MGTDRSNVPDGELNRKAAALRALHAGPVLVLPNAWDPASAALVAGLGAAAVATTSGGVAWAHGLLDIAALESLVASVPLPVNAMAVAGGPTIEQLATAGVRRVSIGTGLAQVAYGAARRAAEELLASGTLGGFAGAIGFMDVDGLLARPDR